MSRSTHRSENLVLWKRDLANLQVKRLSVSRLYQDSWKTALIVLAYDDIEIIPCGFVRVVCVVHAGLNNGFKPDAQSSSSVCNK